MPHLTGFQPTGSLQLGNYLGAIRPFIDRQTASVSHADAASRAATASPTACDAAGRTGGGPVVIVVNLHALTVEHDPVALHRLARECAATLLAAGVDPSRWARPTPARPG